MVNLLEWCFYMAVLVPVVLAGMPWSSSSALNRVPGLHPYNGRIAYPQFLTMGMGHETTGNDAECRRIPADCPEKCRKVDRTGCAICTCDNHRKNNGDCPEPPADCPSSCRKRERGCNVCKCDEKESDHTAVTSNSGGLSALRDNITTKCLSMVMCMVKCEAGYKLGDVIDSRGCQPCRCIKDQGHLRDGDDHGDTTSTSHSWSSSSSNNALSGSHDSSTGSTWNNGGDSLSGNSWSNGGTGSDTHDVWKTENGVGSDGNGCSGPMCPSSSGINPMHPGSGSSTGGGASGCTGPFCANGGGGGMGMGGGASSSSGGGASSCTGPFCISGGMGGGGGMLGGAMGGNGGGVIGGGGMGGDMVGGNGGGMGGSLGGSGGTGGFSPFDVTAPGGRGGDASGCSGPYCGMASDGQGGSMSNQPSSGTYRNCEGPSCAAKDGYQSYY